MLMGRFTHLKAPRASAANLVTLWQWWNREQNSDQCKTSGVMNMPKETRPARCSGGIATAGVGCSRVTFVLYLPLRHRTVCIVIAGFSE